VCRVTRTSRDARTVASRRSDSVVVIISIAIISIGVFSETSRCVTLRRLMFKP